MFGIRKRAAELPYETDGAWRRASKQISEAATTLASVEYEIDQMRRSLEGVAVNFPVLPSLPR